MHLCSPVQADCTGNIPFKAGHANAHIGRIAELLETWQDQYRELGQRSEVQHVLVFENKGEAMGASNPHPHGQIWAIDTPPNEPFKEDRQQRAYMEEQGRPLLVAYAAIEAERWLGEKGF